MACLAVLATTSCSSIENPAPAGGAGGSIGGGVGGSTGGPPILCQGTSMACVRSCSQPYVGVDVVCDHGTWRCPDGSTTYSSCPVWSCGRYDSTCCDAVTGAIAMPACQSDGMRAPCAAGSRPTTESACVPDDLAGSDCFDLYGKQCAIENQRCWSNSTRCQCLPADAGLAWSCMTLAV